MNTRTDEVQASARGIPRSEFLDRLERQLASGGALTLVLHEIPPDHWRESDTWQLRLSRLPSEERRVLLETLGLRYSGADPVRRQLFEPARADGRGFSPIALLAVGPAQRVLEQAWIALGLRSAGDAELQTEGERGDQEAGLRETIPDGEGPRPGLRNLVTAARDGLIRPPICRETEIAECIRVLSKRNKAGAMLVGEAGVGKTAVAEGLACRMAEGRVPPSMANAELLEVNLAALAAGATHLNEFEGRMAEILDRARDNPEVILFLDEAHMIRDARSDASQMMKADLGRGRIRCVGATTPGEYRIIEEDPALLRRFQRITVMEPSREIARQIVRSAVPAFETHHGIHIPEELVVQTVDLAKRFIRNRRLPDSALDLMDEACSRAVMAKLGQEASR